jgi:hypothetical protein
MTESVTEEALDNKKNKPSNHAFIPEANKCLKLKARNQVAMGSPCPLLSS